VRCRNEDVSENLLDPYETTCVGLVQTDQAPPAIYALGTRIASGVVTPRWELAYLCTYWLVCDLGVRKKRQRRGPEQSEGTAANESSSAARAERARTPRGGDTPALDPSVRGTPGRRVCRTAYLEHLRPVWFRHGCVWNRPREAGARKLRPVGAKVRSGRRGGSPDRTMDYRI
jgi:hypothetical protein